MREDTKATLRVGICIALFFLACTAFYYSLFWGWASGAGSVNQPRLKFASNVALAVSFVSFWASVGILFVPYLARKKKQNAASNTAHVP